METYIHKCHLSVRDADLDSFQGVPGHKFLEYFSHASTHMIKILGWDIKKLFENGYECTILDIRLSFKKSLYADDEFEVYSDLKFKGSAAPQTIFDQAIYREKDHSIIATAKYTGCVLDLKTKEIAEINVLNTALLKYLENNNVYQIPE